MAKKNSDNLLNHKQQQLLDAARSLFWKYGFKKVNVQDICQEAGVSKMTFYRFYADKTTIAKSVFEREVDNGMKRFSSIMKEKISAADKVKKILQMKKDGVNDVSKEFLKDFYDSPELGLKQFIDEKTRSAWFSVLKEFKSAQRKGIFRKDLRPEFLFFLSQKMGEMLNDPWLLQQYKDPKDMIIEFSNFFAYGITARKE